MKTSKLYFFAIAFMALSISMVSCSGDDGEAGLVGPKGDTGAQGVAGAVGPAGADGSIIYSGEGEPADATGVISDYYLDVATGMLYGPKEADDSWADIEGFSLKGIDGADGVDGVDGNETLSGEGVPTAEDGDHGDFYLDTETAILYGPKNNRGLVLGQTGWAAGLELKGADGNANVKSYLFSIVEDLWILTDANQKLYIYDERMPLYDKITDDIIESGVVLIYRIAANNRAILLPSSTKTDSGNLLTESFVIGGQDRIYIQRELFTFADSEEELAKETFDYRAVIITGELASEVMSKANDQIGFDLIATEMGLVK